MKWIPSRIRVRVSVGSCFGTCFRTWVRDLDAIRVLSFWVRDSFEMWMFSSLFGIWKLGLGLGFGAGSFGAFCLLFSCSFFSSRFVVCCDHEDLGFVESPSPSSLRC